MNVPTAAEAAGIFVIAVGGMLALVQFGLHLVYDYALTATRFEVRLFGRFPVYGIAFAQMTDARAWHLSLAEFGRSFLTLSLGNRIGAAIVIERRARFPRYVVVTPGDADAMLRVLRERIAEAQRP